MPNEIPRSREVRFAEQGARLRYVREEILACTQTALAQALDVRRATISDWERGIMDPGLSQVRRIRNIAAKLGGSKWHDSFFFMDRT